METKTFKSFKPRKMATLKENNYRLTDEFNWLGMFDHSFNELCINCGYPYGRHHLNDTCPTKEQANEHREPNDYVIPYHKPKKVSGHKLNVRKFNKFLYDNGLLEEYYRNLKENEKKNTFFIRFLKRNPRTNWIDNAFSWSESPEDIYTWIEMHRKWQIHLLHERIF